MKHRSISHLLLCLTILYIFCSQAIALPALDSYSAIRNNSPLDKPMPVKRHADAIFTAHIRRILNRIATMKCLQAIIAGERCVEDANEPVASDASASS